VATSSTFNFNLDLTDILEDAYELAGSELRSGFDFERGRRCIDLLMLEWQNEETNLFTLKADSLTLVAGTPTYALDAERLVVVDVAYRTDAGVTTAQTDTYLRRISASAYARISNKLSRGRPSRYWVQQTPDGPSLTVWQVPDTAETLYYHYLERIEDTGTTGSNNMDVPGRFLPAMVYGVAHLVAQRIPEGQPRVSSLKANYDEAWDKATDAARDRSHFRIRPGGYR
jgi:hypothetical protein